LSCSFPGFDCFRGKDKSYTASVRRTAVKYELMAVDKKVFIGDGYPGVFSIGKGFWS
jgi:hypothetical protein